jgi:hypothetical protein
LNYPIADGGYAVAVADVNGDGKLDVVESYTGSRNYVMVFLGNGNGTVAPPQTFAAGVQPLGLAVSDLNNDGRPDIVVTGGFPDVEVLLGNNDGSFTGQTYQVVSRSKPPFPSIAAFAPQQTIGVGPEPRSVVTADLNGDGKPDLVVVNSGLNSIGQRLNSVGVMLGNGNGTFAPERTFATGLAPWSVAVADVNHDGIPDLIVADSGGNDVSVLLGNGNGTFASHVTFATGRDPLFVTVADVNGDGKPDLIVPNYVSRTVSVLLGNGNGTFAPQQAFATGSGSISVAIADFNHDGKLDLAVANRQWNSVSVLLGNGNGTFQPQVTYATGSTPDWIAAADVNVDGSADIVVANQAGNSVGMLLGNGDGTFLPQQTFAAGPAPVSIAVADINGDGSPDVIVTDYNSNAAAVLLGNGDGTFQAIKTFATGMAPVAVAVADLNRDGRLDLAVTNYSGSVSVLIGDVPPHVVSINRTSPAGPITSASTVRYTVTFSEPVTGVDAGDFALALKGVAANAPIVTPASSSVYTVTISGISGSGALGLNLVDNGSIRDAAGNPLQPGGVSFQPQQTYGTRDTVNSVAVGDVNLDGQLDIVAGTGTGESSPNLLTGNGNGTFQPTQLVEEGGGHSVVIADMNGDGKPDIVAGSNFAEQDGVAIVFGNGGGTFGPAGAFLPIYYSYVRSIAVGDINGDGIPDVIAASRGMYGTGIDLFLGNGNGTFGPNQQHITSSIPVFVALADVNGDGQPDIIAAYANGTIGVDGSVIATGTNPVSIASGDLNGDGKMDLVVANQGSDELSILLGNGNGTFQPQRTLATGHLPNSVAVADLNGDGIPDLIVANGEYSTLGSDTPDGSVGIFLGNGNGTFQPQRTLATGSIPVAVAVADVNGDGRPDIIVGNENSDSVSVLLGNSAGSFTGQTYAILPVADTINGTSGNDTITLQRNPDGTDIDWTLGSSAGQLPANDPAGLTVNGNGGNDTINLDYTNGNPVPNALHLNGTFTINNFQGTNPLAGTTLDIGKSTVFISYSSSDPIAAIQGYLKSGYNSGGWNGTPTATTGVITSLSAQTNPNHNTAIGYADSADGQGVNATPNTIELKYTLYGDANLDAQVNSADLQILVFSLNRPGAWDQGDFNYDGQVNSADLQALLFTLNTSLGSQAATMAVAATPAAAPPTATNSARSGSSTNLMPAIQKTGSSNPIVQRPAKAASRKRR